MKIGFDAKRLFNNYTGLGNYSRTIVKNLLEYYPENEIQLYTPNIVSSEETKYFLENNIKTFVPKNTFKSYWRSFSIAKQLRNDKIDIFHGLSNELPFSLKKGAKPKTIVTIHDLIFKIFPETYPTIDRLIYDFKFKSACQNADKIIAISENTKDDIIKYYKIEPEKIDVIYQTCNPIYFNPKNAIYVQKIGELYKLPKEYLLYVGSIEPRKNLLNIIKSYKYLNIGIKIPLVIVGNGGKYKKEVLQFIEDENLSSMFIWLKVSNNEHLQAIYQNAQLLIYPSFYEGFGIPIIEALLSNIPVIAANTSSLKEAAGPNSIYIDPSQPIQIANAIEKILTDQELKNEIIQNGNIYAKNKFDPKIVTSQLYDLYKIMIN